MRGPERETIVERIRISVLELDCPCGPAIQCLVHTKICRVISNGHEIGDVSAESLHIAELQSFGSRYDTCGPSLATIGRARECPIAAACPHYLGVNWPHRDKAVGGAAVL